MYRVYICNRQEFYLEGGELEYMQAFTPEIASQPRASVHNIPCHPLRLWYNYYIHV